MTQPLDPSKKHSTTPRAHIIPPSEPVREPTARPPQPAATPALPLNPCPDRPWRCMCGFGSRTYQALVEHLALSKGKKHQADVPRNAAEQAAWAIR